MPKPAHTAIGSASAALFLAARGSGAASSENFPVRPCVGVRVGAPTVAQPSPSILRSRAIHGAKLGRACIVATNAASFGWVVASG